MMAERPSGVSRSAPSLRQRLGVHTSIAGGLPASLERAKNLGCSTLQIFSHNPRTWKVSLPASDEASRFVDARRRLDISPLFIHTSYLINLAAANPDLLDRSQRLLAAELDIADILGAEHLVLHTGSASGDDEQRARQRAVGALREVSAAGAWRTTILLENTAGERGDITSRIEDLAGIIDALGDRLIGGICLDTCHAFSAGYALADDEGLDDLARDIHRHLGPDAVKLIHLNDAKRAFNSRVDRHEHLGRGAIGAEGLQKVLAHRAFRGTPVILETPKKDEEDDRRNLAAARHLMPR